MSKCLFYISSMVLALLSFYCKAQTFQIQDIIISDTSSSFQDPEIDWTGNHYCWAGPEGIWIGKIDKTTGDFIPENGKGILIDSTPSYLGMQLVKNGPEWAMSRNGSVCIYPDSADDKTIRIGTAKLIDNKWIAEPLPNSSGRIPFFGSYDENYLKDGITCVSYDPQTMKKTGMRLRNSSDTGEIIPTDMQGGRWIKGLYAISMSQEKQSPYEAGYFDANSKQYNKIATFETPIDQAWIVPLPEYDSIFALWCVEKKSEQDQISIFVRVQDTWQKIDSISVPTDRKEIFSPEPFWWNGKSYIFLVARPGQGQSKSLYDQVWIIGLAREERLFREISSQSPMKRTDPEVFYTESEPVIYYTETRNNGIRVIHKCSTGLADDFVEYPISPFNEMLFSKDYYPGTEDINGRYLGSTETMTIVTHKGRLYAGMGNWMDYPWQFDESNEGSQILRKDSYNSPWVADTSFGFRSMRTDAVVSVYLNKDVNGNNLNPPVNLLVCGAGDISVDRPREMNIWVRDDDQDRWIKNTGFTVAKGGTGIRCFVIHTDKVTEKQHLFCGMSEGDIIKAQYNPDKPGWLEIDTARELRGMGRVMAMCVCNGYLYASAGVDIVAGDTIGGLFRRIDGTDPTWELIYTWPYIQSASGGDEPNIMRGLTCVTDPEGTNKDVIIGTRAFPGIVEAIDPSDNHKVVTEFYIKDFFTSQWGKSYKGPALSAYNYFVPDTIEGEEIWWQSLWVSHPDAGDGHPYNGSHFLVRIKDGTYKSGDIFDNNNPVPKGQNLRACRTICKSPFPEEPGTYYFGGYDAAKDTSNNTAWIYKGVLKNSSSVIYDNVINQNDLVLYPNPSGSVIYLKSQEENLNKYEIYNTFGQKLLTGNLTKGEIDITTLQAGIYFLRITTSENKFLTKKFIKE